MKTISINGYTFQCKYNSTRSGFSHICSLIKEGELLSEAKSNYLNRTWERYTYQSVMREVVWKLIIQKEKEFLDEYKKENGLGRLSKDRKRVALSTFYLQLEIKELEELIKNLNDNIY